MSKTALLSIWLLLPSFLAVSLPAQGQEGGRKQIGNRNRIPDFLLRKFDKDGDGKLSDEERKEMRESWRNRTTEGKRGSGKKRSFGGTRGSGKNRSTGGKSSVAQDALTPQYYKSSKNTAFKSKVDHFIEAVRKERFHHPLKNKSGDIPEYTVPSMGQFGVQKGKGQHHAAVDLRLKDSGTIVGIHAAHDGIVHTVRDAPKYRHYVSVSKEIKDDQGQIVGKLLTIYAHVDLDLDEADSLAMDGKHVEKGELISKHLYSKTRGGPHLHFEIRYYRPEDKGNETFYGFLGKDELKLSEPSAGPFSIGYWNPNIGYGYGYSPHHGLSTR